jgi:hypothetical protein
MYNYEIAYKGLNFITQMVACKGDMRAKDTKRLEYDNKSIVPMK